MPSWAIILFLAAELPLFSFALSSPRRCLLTISLTYHLPTKLQQWTDAVVALYFLLTAVSVWVHRAQFPHWKFYLSIHLVAATGIWMLRRLRP